VYVGHFAAGLALKAVEPKAPTWGLLIGVGLMDLLFGPFVLLGIEHASITPGVSPGFSLDFIDWSHSLAMSLVWSVAFALLFVRLGKRVAAVMGFAVFSHFLLDLPMHPSDLALWPHSSAHLGFGLWRALPQGWWFLELGAIAAGWGWYAWKARTASTFGGKPVAVGVVLAILHVMNSPWLH
jgi:hypothetical protein